jgi:hypothetical protein
MKKEKKKPIDFPDPLITRPLCQVTVEFLVSFSDTDLQRYLMFHGIEYVDYFSIVAPDIVAPDTIFTQRQLDEHSLRKPSNGVLRAGPVFYGPFCKTG